MITTPAQRRERSREQTKADILDAARAVMRRDGVAGLNLQEVAQLVGIRAPSLYEYFAGKADLYDALFLLGMRTYSARVAATPWNPDRVWESMSRLMQAYMEFAHDAPELYALLFERHVPGFAPSADTMAEARTLLGGGYEKFRASVARNAFAPSVAPEAAFDLFIAVMHGLASLHLANEPELPADAGRFGSLVPTALAVLESAWTGKPASEQI